SGGVRDRFLSTVEESSMTPVARLAALLGILAFVALAMAFAALFMGSAPVSPRAVIAVLTGRDGGPGVPDVIVLSLRLPRILAALLAGGALAGAGGGLPAPARQPPAPAAPLRVSGRAARRGLPGAVVGP